MVDMKIRIVNAIVTQTRLKDKHSRVDYVENKKELFGLCPDTEVDNIEIEKGPSSIECRYDEILAIPYIVKRVKEAEEEGIDACVVDCFGDPGVRASREVVKIPVLGPCESSLLVASSMCDRFSVITVLRSVAGLIEENARIYGVSDKLASVRAVEIPVLELHKDGESTAKALFNEGEKALSEDDAEAIILGCTGMTGMAKKLSDELKVQVIDPLPTAVKFAETLVSLGLSHSKLTFPNPPEKKRYY